MSISHDREPLMSDTTAAASETVWLSRDSHLEKVPGFVQFHLLKGPEAEDHTLYASHTVWKNRATFEAWTKSEAFRAGGKQAALSWASAVMHDTAFDDRLL